MTFVHSFQSEWLKRKRSLATWLVIVGGFFTPVIVIAARLLQPEKTIKTYSSPDFWFQLWRNSWESMAIMLLPMGVILATSLVTQLEYKNNTWKQVHASPVGLATLYFSKLSVIIFMMFQFFILFNIGIYLSAIIPYLVMDVEYPSTAIPYMTFLKDNALYFVDCLPIIGLQYLISLRFKNFLVPVGAGLILLVGSIFSISWKYGYLVPYSYCMYHYLMGIGKAHPAGNTHLMATGYFLLFTVTGFILFATKKERG